MAQIYIGTSGWSYEHWKEVFYPKGLPSNEQIDFLSSVFSTVEINSTFYHLPAESVVKNWSKKVPKDFIFSVKASRFITHVKKLKGCEENVDFFFQRMKHLKRKFGPTLFQLPPSLKQNRELLESFISYLPDNRSIVFEFRHPTWYTDEIYDLLYKFHLGLCISDLEGHLSPLEVTSDFAYIRLHGPKRAYQGSYSDRALKEWQKRLEKWAAEGLSSFCYFDNDEKGYAPQDAIRLLHFFS